MPPVSRPTRPAQGPSAEGPGSPDGLRCASRGDQSPHVPPCPPGGLGGKGSFLAQGPKASKVSVKPFQRLAVSKGGAFGRSPQGAKCFSEGSIFLCFFLFAIEKERRKPFALHRGRHPGRGAAGLLVTNGGQPFGAEKPDEPVPGGRADCPSKTPQWGVLESSGPSVRGLFNEPPAGLPVHWRWAFLWCKGNPPLQKAPAAPKEQRGPCFTYLLAGGAYSST